MPALGGNLDLSSLLVPGDQAQLFEDGGQSVPLVPAGQRLDTALGKQASEVGVAEIGTFENCVNLLIAYKVGDRVHAGVAPVARVGHGNLYCRRRPPWPDGGNWIMCRVQITDQHSVGG